MDRHSTITLTMDRHAHLGVVDLVDALKRVLVLERTYQLRGGVDMYTEIYNPGGSWQTAQRVVG